MSELEFSRDYDLPPAIVWDALVDEVLVEGWLAAARIDLRVGGVYWLNWQTGGGLAPTNGVIEAIVVARRLAIDTDNIGHLEFVLEPLPDGTRGEGTLLALNITVDTEPRLLASTYAYWLSNFDQLEDLLRGHPVDWATWQRDRGEAWSRYLRSASGLN
ncbi:MAG TPA: SRPBCC domain-containing protein [Galbitalea sp.]|jgi:uncharacterized protein YndB with AHSA1/START domain|nr:SRPBCC domain-containing protein [Galbitalea sp.]